MKQQVDEKHVKVARALISHAFYCWTIHCNNNIYKRLSLDLEETESSVFKYLEKMGPEFKMETGKYFESLIQFSLIFET